MSAPSRFRELVQGFSRTFWVANTLELFERFAFYGAKAVLTIYLAQRVGLGPQTAGSLAGLFSGVLYCLPIVAGTIVDRYGFKRSLAACFSIFCVGGSEMISSPGCGAVMDACGVPRGWRTPAGRPGVGVA